MRAVFVCTCVYGDVGILFDWSKKSLYFLHVAVLFSPLAGYAALGVWGKWLVDIAIIISQVGESVASILRKGREGGRRGDHCPSHPICMNPSELLLFLLLQVSAVPTSSSSQRTSKVFSLGYLSEC